MRAARFHGEPELRIDQIDEPTLRPGHARIAVRAVGICGSDLHILQGHTPTAFTPITLGHEIAGIVDELMPAADITTEIRPGDHVFVNPLIGCGSCRHCAAGEPNLCPRRTVLGIHHDGGLADLLLAPIANLTVLPRSVGFPEAALIESAGTAHHSLRRAGVRAGTRLLVLGAGGIGTQVIRLAVAAGAHVCVVDADPAALAGSLRAGAAAAHLPTEDGLVESVLADAGAPEGLDAAIDCVGVPATFRTAVEVLGMAGRCAVVGIGDRPLELTDPARFVRRGLQVSAVYGYSRADIERVSSLLVDGTLDLAASVSTILPLDDVNAGIKRVSAPGAGIVRVVIEPTTSGRALGASPR